MALEDPFKTSSEQKASVFESPAQYLERSKKVGAAYANFIERVIGRDVPNEVKQQDLGEGIQEKLHAIEISAETHLDAVEREVVSRQISAKDLLAQVPSFQSEDVQQIIADESSYELKRNSKGIYTILMKSGVFARLRPGASAAAFGAQGKIPFLMLRTFSGEENKEVERREQEENIYHETHHLVWRFALQDKLIRRGENDDDVAHAFTMYQNELLARSVSNGWLGGYHHLYLKGEKEEARFKEENPEKYNSIQETILRINTLLADINEKISNSKVEKKDFVLAALEATTFAELEKNIEKIAIMVEETHAPKNSETNASQNGWDVV